MRTELEVCRKFVKMCASIKRVDPDNLPPDGTPVISIRKSDGGKKRVMFYRQGEGEKPISLKDAFIREVKKNLRGNTGG
jgi:hypothetical protein